MTSKGMHLETLTAGVLFLRRERPGFDPDWGAEMEAGVRKQLDACAMKTFVPEVAIVGEPTLRAALDECEAAGVDVLITLQTTMSDGRMAPVLTQRWPWPVVLWATPERQTGSMISACSLVGVHTWAATLAQLGRPFEIVYGMPGEAETVANLEEAVRVAYAARAIQQANAGLVGFHAPGFIDMHADPFALSKELGMQLRHFSLHEFVDRARGFSEEEVRADLEAVGKLGLPLDDATEEDLPTASRLYLAMRALMDETRLDALAVREWPELPNVLGQWPYLGMARLAAEGRAVGCEGDMDGAITCFLGQILGGGETYLSDWLEHGKDRITLWHGGNAPPALCKPVGSPEGPRLGKHFNNKKPVVLNADLAVGMPVTVYRLWHGGGKYLATAADAETIEPARTLKGTNGLATVPGVDVPAWFDKLCHAGFPHHPAVMAGHHAERLHRFARQIGIAWIPCPAS